MSTTAFETVSKFSSEPPDQEGSNEDGVRSLSTEAGGRARNQWDVRHQSIALVKAIVIAVSRRGLPRTRRCALGSSIRHWEN